MTEEWIEPWYSPDEQQRHYLEEELKKELAEAHPLAGLPIKVVARRDDRDDVIVALDKGRIAEVHLTWSSRREADSRWPRTIIFESMEAWHSRPKDCDA
jgi:hypothetical protein